MKDNLTLLGYDPLISVDSKTADITSWIIGNWSSSCLDTCGDIPFDWVRSGQATFKHCIRFIEEITNTTVSANSTCAGSLNENYGCYISSGLQNSTCVGYNNTGSDFSGDIGIARLCACSRVNCNQVLFPYGHGNVRMLIPPWELIVIGIFLNVLAIPFLIEIVRWREVPMWVINCKEIIDEMVSRCKNRCRLGSGYSCMEFEIVELSPAEKERVSAREILETHLQGLECLANLIIGYLPEIEEEIEVEGVTVFNCCAGSSKRTIWYRRKIWEMLCIYNIICMCSICWTCGTQNNAEWGNWWHSYQIFIAYNNNSSFPMLVTLLFIDEGNLLEDTYIIGRLARWFFYYLCGIEFCGILTHTFVFCGYYFEVFLFYLFLTFTARRLIFKHYGSLTNKVWIRVVGVMATFWIHLSINTMILVYSGQYEYWEPLLREFMARDIVCYFTNAVNNPMMGRWTLGFL